MPAVRHRVRVRTRTEYWAKRAKTRDISDYKTKYNREIRKARTDNIIGIDGEGQGRFPHRYTYLAASNDIREWSVENQRGLKTVQCLDFILGLPDNALVVGFSFGYDLTKILATLTTSGFTFCFMKRHARYVSRDVSTFVLSNGTGIVLIT